MENLISLEKKNTGATHDVHILVWYAGRRSNQHRRVFVKHKYVMLKFRIYKKFMYNMIPALCA